MTWHRVTPVCGAPPDGRWRATEVRARAPSRSGTEVTTRAGKFRADTLVKKLPRRAWQKLSAGAGAKRHRFYDWAAIDLPNPATEQPAADPPRSHHRRTRLLPLLLTRASTAGHAGTSRWIKMASGRDVPVRQLQPKAVPPTSVENLPHSGAAHAIIRRWEAPHSLLAGNVTPAG